MNKTMALLVFSLVIPQLFGQTGGGNSQPASNTQATQKSELNQAAVVQNYKSIPDDDVRLQLARADINYKPIPGDTFKLTYFGTREPVSINGLIESDYVLNFGYLGKFDAKDITYITLKNRVESKIASQYPNSTPFLMLESVGQFMITLSGEVKTSTAYAWGLSRLNDIIGNNIQNRASLRKVSLIRNGATYQYDLLSADLSKFEENPLLLPGDRLFFPKATKVVSITGAVEKTGNYELNENETFSDLLKKLAGGFSLSADMTQISVSRIGDLKFPTSKSIVFDYTTQSDFELIDGDIITVPDRNQYLPVVYLEGAFTFSGNTSVVEADSSSRQAIRFLPGASIEWLARTYYYNISPMADLSNAYILRNDQRIKCDLREVLYSGKKTENNLKIENNDSLVIPFKQFMVSVAGPVENPGKYPYLPNRTAKYYIALAGGIDNDYNTNGAFRFVDMNGTIKKNDDYVAPEDSITVESNSLKFILGEIAPVLTIFSTVITVTASIISIGETLKWWNVTTTTPTTDTAGD